MSKHTPELQPQAWIVYCPPGHEFDSLVFHTKRDAEIQAEDFNLALPEGEGYFEAIPLYNILDLGIAHAAPGSVADAVTSLRELIEAITGDGFVVETAGTLAMEQEVNRRVKSARTALAAIKIEGGV